MFWIAAARGRYGSKFDVLSMLSISPGISIDPTSDTQTIGHPLFLRRAYLLPANLTFAQADSLKLERLPVTREAAGSSPVAPAKPSTRTPIVLCQSHGSIVSALPTICPVARVQSCKCCRDLAPPN